MTPKQFERDIEAAEARIQAIAEEFGRRYWEEQVKPFCIRFGLEFISGMGTTVFYLKGKPIYSWDERDTPARLRPALKRFEQEMLTDIAGRDLGQYVPDYKEGKS